MRYGHDLDTRETQVRAKLDPRDRKREAPPPLPDGSLSGIFTNDQGAKLRGPYAAMAKATQSHRAAALEAASQKRANDLPPNYRRVLEKAQRRKEKRAKRRQAQAIARGQ